MPEAHKGTFERTTDSGLGSWLDDLHPKANSVFIDNLMLCSADRLLSGHYPDQKAYRSLAAVPETLVIHDLFNLAILVESLVCHEQLFVNAEFADRWNPGIADGSMSHISGLITTVSWPAGLRSQAEEALHEAIRRRMVPLEPRHVLEDAMVAVYRATHHPRDWDVSVVERALFLDYSEGDHVWGSPFYIQLGTMFYLLTSQLAGIPYKPSALRARILNDALMTEVRSRQFPASEIAIDLVTLERKRTAEKYLSRLMELNLIELNIPLILAAVMRSSKSREGILPAAIEMRAGSAAREFRKWCAEFGEAAQGADLLELARLSRDVQGLTESLNRELGISEPEHVKVKLGWGPISSDWGFSLPRILGWPARRARHLWLLHDLYRSVMAMRGMSGEVRRLLQPGLPAELTEVRLDEMDWATREWP
jgi:hypothetical protein